MCVKWTLLCCFSTLCIDVNAPWVSWTSVSGRTCSGYLWTPMCLRSSKMDHSKARLLWCILLTWLLMDAPAWQIKHSKWLFAQRGAGVDILSHEFFDVFKSLNVTCTWKWVCCVYSPGVAWWLCGWRLTCDGRRWVSTWKLLFRRRWAGDTPHREKCFQVTCMGWIVEIIKGNQGRFSHWGFVFFTQGLI